MRKLNVLIACECSQTVCKAFRELGHNAYSCDIEDCYGGHPEWHIKDDCLKIIALEEKRDFFGEPIPVVYTQDGERHIITRERWDLIIAHPPCTYLSNSGSRYLNADLYGEKAIERQHRMVEAAKFFETVIGLCGLHAYHYAVENPLGVMSKFDKPDQIIQPWQFGDNVQKSTCLWTCCLPNLVPEITSRQEPDVVEYTNRRGETKRMERFFYETRFLPADERRRLRSKTFDGIARAMATQWSAAILAE